MWMTKTMATRVSGKVFHKHKYITNPDVTPEDRVITAMGKLSQEIRGNSCNNHLSDTTLDQLTRLGEILKSILENEQKQQQTTRQNTIQTSQRSARIATNSGHPVPHTLSNPTLLTRPPATAPTPPRVSLPQRTTTTITALFRPATPPRVQPPRRSPRLAEQASKRAIAEEIL